MKKLQDAIKSVKEEAGDIMNMDQVEARFEKFSNRVKSQLKKLNGEMYGNIDARSQEDYLWAGIVAGYLTAKGEL